RFAFRPEVRQLLDELQSQAVFKANAVQQFQGAAVTLAQLARGPNFPPSAIIAPATASADDTKWKRLDELAANVPELQQPGEQVPPKLVGYDDAKLAQVVDTVTALVQAWRNQDAGTVNTQIKALASQLPAVAPAQ